MVKHIWIVLFFLVQLAPAFGQDGSTVLLKVIETMNQDQYEYRVTYKLFKGLEGTKAYESYSGVIARDCNNVYQQLGPMEFVQTESFFVKLNHEDKEILIGEHQTSPISPLPAIDGNALLGYYRIDGLSTANGIYILKLSAKDTAPLGVGKLLLEVDNENFRIKKQVILMDAKADFSVYGQEAMENEFDNIRIEINFSGFKDEVDYSVFKRERYFIKEGDRIQPTKEFVDFEYITTN